MEERSRRIAVTPLVSKSSARARDAASQQMKAKTLKRPAPKVRE
jgi:hypothetical protein